METSQVEQGNQSVSRHTKTDLSKNHYEAMVHDKMYDFSIFFSAENAGELKYMIFSELLIDA